jgi:type VI secretion system VgrG family protein
MSTTEHARYTLVFRTAAGSAPEFFVREVDGREGLSQLFCFDLVLESRAALSNEVIDDLLANRAWLAFGDAEEHPIHGVVREVQLLSSAEPTPVLYRVRLVPRLFDTTFTRGSWVYQDLTAPQILKDVLGEFGLHEPDDFELRLTRKYTPYEYKVQYEETDFHFLSRVMEYEGIFYFFEHGEHGAKVVFSDANNAFAPLEAAPALAYDPRAGTTGAEARVSSISRLRRTVPSKVTLRDYNYRTPSTPLVAEQPVDEAGVGEQLYYGEHFKDVPQGSRLARVRAQELNVPRDVFSGVTSLRGLRAGHRFALEGHPIEGMDQDYVVTALRHTARQAGVQTGAQEPAALAYRNEFEAIPHAVPWRPARVTPQPRIHGVIHGKVDAASDGVRATPVDEHGRYKVILPWDVAGTPGGKASRWIRMAQPSSGSGFGVQFPLHVGTEVLLVHVNGDPDRPIIASSVPNMETASPVNAGNATQSQIRTRHGITVTFDDQSG